MFSKWNCTFIPSLSHWQKWNLLSNIIGWIQNVTLGLDSGHVLLVITLPLKICSGDCALIILLPITMTECDSDFHPMLWYSKCQRDNDVPSQIITEPTKMPVISHLCCIPQFSMVFFVLTNGAQIKMGSLLE